MHVHIYMLKGYKCVLLLDYIHYAFPEHYLTLYIVRQGPHIGGRRRRAGHKKDLK